MCACVCVCVRRLCVCLCVCGGLGGGHLQEDVADRTNTTTIATYVKGFARTLFGTPLRCYCTSALWRIAVIVSPRNQRHNTVRLLGIFSVFCICIRRSISCHHCCPQPTCCHRIQQQRLLVSCRCHRWRQTYPWSSFCTLHGTPRCQFSSSSWRRLPRWLASP